MKKTFYRIRPSENRICVLPDGGEDWNDYTEWIKNFVQGVAREQQENVKTLLSVEMLNKVADQKNNTSACFRYRLQDEEKWSKIWIFPEKNPDSCLMLTESIQEEYIRERRRERNTLYIQYRKRELFLQKKGIDCGMAAIELREPYRIMAATGRFMEFMENPGTGGFWNYYQKQISRTIEKMKAQPGAPGKSDEMVGYYNLETMDHGPYRWLRLVGHVIKTANEKWYLYLQYTDLSGGKDGELMTPPRLKQAEEYFFEWDIFNDRITMSENWQSKFRKAADDAHNTGIEPFIWKEDMMKLQKSLNAILKGKIQEDTLIRLFVQNRERPYAWCNISYMSVFFENGIPAFVVGKVRDINYKLEAIFEDALRQHRLSPMSLDESRKKLEMLFAQSQGRRHAFFSFGLSKIADIHGKNSGAMLVYQHLDELTELIEPDDLIWVDNGALMFCLTDIKSDRYVKERAAKIRVKLREVSGGVLSATLGTAIYPDNGTDYDTLTSYAKIATWKKVKGNDILNELYLAGIDMEELEKREEDMPHRLISDIVQEWYQVIRKNTALEKKMELAEAQMMLSQIKPHFIYNVLANIKSLIYKDPDLACDVIVTFTKYLRVQLNALGKGELAPFSEIIDAVDKFVKIEQSRFPEKIRMIYDIRYRDFQLPHFIIQPLVENAIQHGIWLRETPGTITIRSYREGDDIFIEVKDDGAGFDVNKMRAPDKEHGVGLENVRLRLEYLMSGSLTIHSAKGKGTTARIKIPKWRNDGLSQ